MTAITRMYGDAVTMVQLHYASATADLGSFSKAAASLGVTQPALSNGIAALERALGGVLFERSTTGATLTPLGTRILPQLQNVLGLIENVFAEIRVAAGREAEPLRVGVSPLIHPGVIARALEAAGRNGLGPLVLMEDNMVPLRDALRSRQLDVILVPALLGGDQFTHRKIDTEPLHYLTAHPTQLQPVRGAVELSELSGKPLVMVGDTCGLTTFTNALFAQAGQRLQRYPGEADTYRSLEDWAALGLGGALLPHSKFRPESDTHPLIHEGTPILIEYEALWHPSSGRAATIDMLIDAMLTPTTGVSRSKPGPPRAR